MYLVFDTETTGLHEGARMTQLGFILLDKNFNIIKEYQSLIKPNGWTIPKDKFFIDNNMSTERCEAEGKDINEVLTEFQNALKLAKYKVAHNIKFDNRILDYELKKNNFTWQLFKYKKNICTMIEGKKIVKGSRWLSLLKLHKILFNKEFDGAHDALVDVKATARVLKYLIENKITIPH